MNNNPKSPDTVPDWDELVGNTSPSPKPSITKPKRISTPRQDYTDLARRISEEEGFDPNITLAVMKQESGGRTGAVSPKGASGLMQLMPATAKARGVTDIFDPEQNVRAGVRELSQHYKANKGDLDRTLASYNWGSGNLQRKGLQNAPKETRDYIRNIRATLGRNTFSEPQPQSQQQPKQDTTPDWDDLVSSSETTPSSPVTRPRRVTPLQSTKKATPTQQTTVAQSQPKNFDWSNIRIDDTKGLPQQKTIAQRIVNAPTSPPSTTKKLGIGDLRAMENKEKPRSIGELRAIEERDRPQGKALIKQITDKKLPFLDRIANQAKSFAYGVERGLPDLAYPSGDPYNLANDPKNVYTPTTATERTNFAPEILRDTNAYGVGKAAGGIGEIIGYSTFLGPVAGTALGMGRQSLDATQEQQETSGQKDFGELIKETGKGAVKGAAFGQASKLPFVNNLVSKIAGGTGAGTARAIAGAAARPVLTGAENAVTSELIDPNIDRAYDFVTGDNSYERNPYVTDPWEARKRDFFLGGALGAGFQLPAAVKGYKSGGIQEGIRNLGTGGYVPASNAIPMPGRIGEQLALPPSPLDPNYAPTQPFSYTEPNAATTRPLNMDNEFKTIPLPPRQPKLNPILKGGVKPNPTETLSTFERMTQPTRTEPVDLANRGTERLTSTRPDLQDIALPSTRPLSQNLALNDTLPFRPFDEVSPYSTQRIVPAEADVLPMTQELQGVPSPIGRPVSPTRPNLNDPFLASEGNTPIGGFRRPTADVMADEGVTPRQGLRASTADVLASEGNTPVQGLVPKSPSAMPSAVPSRMPFADFIREEINKTGGLRELFPQDPMAGYAELSARMQDAGYPPIDPDYLMQEYANVLMNDFSRPTKPSGTLQPDLLGQEKGFSYDVADTPIAGETVNPNMDSAYLNNVLGKPPNFDPYKTNEIQPGLSNKDINKIMINPGLKFRGVMKGKPKPFYRVLPEDTVKYGVGTQEQADYRARPISETGKIPAEGSSPSRSTKTNLNAPINRPAIEQGKGVFDPFAYDKNAPSTPKPPASPEAVKEAYNFFKEMENQRGSENLAVGPTGELHSPYFDKPVKYNPAIVDLDRLLTSHDQYFSERPGFPKAYQPRDRKLSAQAFYGEGGIIPRFNPALVAGDSISPGEGRPTIEATVDPLTGKRKVISGNKRTMAEEIIYNSFPEKAQELKDYMVKNPPRGMSSQQVAQAIAKGKKPAAVNILKQMSEDELIKFAKVANEPNIEDYSPLERARVDADSIDIKRLGKIGGTSDLTAAENRAFAEDFVNKIATPANRGKLYKNGELTQEGVRRMQNALFVKAFGDSPETLRILSDITESTSTDYKNIANALAAKAPRIAQVKALGNMDANYDISNDLMVSLNQYANLRKSNLPIDDYIKQKGVGDELTDNQKQLLKLFDETKRSPNQLKQTLDNYLDTAQKEVKTNAEQESMFGQLGQEKGEVLGQAVEQTFAERQRAKAEQAEKKAQKEKALINKLLKEKGGLFGSEKGAIGDVGKQKAGAFFSPETWQAATRFARFKAEALGRNLIAGTADHYNQFSKDLVAEFGGGIKPYVDKLYDASRQNKELPQPIEFNQKAEAQFLTNKEKQQGLFPKGKTTTNLSPTQYQANMGINPNFSPTGRIPSQQPSLPGMTGQLSSSTPKKEQPLLKTISSLIKANMLVNASSALGDTTSTAGRLVAKNAIADTTRGAADSFLSKFGQVVEDPSNPGKFIKAGTNERTYIAPSLKDVANNLGAGVKGIKGAKDIIFKSNLTPDQLAELSQHEAKTKGSDNSLLLRGVDNYVNTVGRVRAAFDEPAYQYALKDATQAEIRVKAANGVASKADLNLAVKEVKDFQDGKINQISSHPRLRKVAEDILAKAKTDAMYETLRDDNAFSKLFSEYKNKLWEGGTAKQALGFVLDQAAPFARTGTNIIRQAGDMSVVGLYNIQKITRQARKQGGLTKDQQGSLAKSLGDVALGSIVGGIAAGLAAGGYATKNIFFNPLSGENKQERELNEAANREGGSFKLPFTDRRATSHIFGTTKPIFEFGVAAQKLLTDPEKTYSQKVSGMANQILNSALDHPASTGARDLVMAFYGPEKAQGLYRQVIKRAATLVTPKLVEQLSQAGGEKRKVTLETEGTLSQRFSQDLTNEIMNRYPWRSSFNQPEYTALGDQNRYPKSNFFDPLRSKEERITPVTTELTKQNVGLNPLQRNKETETPADFAARSRDVGKLTNQQLGELFKSKTYADLPKIRQTQSYLKKDTELTDRKLREEAIKDTERLSHAGELAIPSLSYLPSVTSRIDKEIDAKLKNSKKGKFTMFLKDKE